MSAQVLNFNAVILVAFTITLVAFVSLFSIVCFHNWIFESSLHKQSEKNTAPSRKFAAKENITEINSKTKRKPVLISNLRLKQVFKEILHPEIHQICSFFHFVPSWIKFCILILIVMLHQLKTPEDTFESTWRLNHKKICLICLFRFISSARSSHW